MNCFNHSATVMYMSTFEKSHAHPPSQQRNADPGMQKDCLLSGHVGQSLPSVFQICFLTPQGSYTGNQMAVQLSFAAGVWSSVKDPQYDTARSICV